MTWELVPIGALFQRVEERGRADLPLLSVYRDLGVVPREGREDNFNRPGEDLDSYKVVRPGDLVLNKMKTWQGSLGVSDYLGIVSPAYFIGRARRDFDRRFVHHLLRSQPLIAEYAARSKGIRPSQWDLPWDEFKTIKVALPSLSEQRAIADYLDAETARIDALIAKKQRLIGLLDERIDAAIMELVGLSEIAVPNGRPSVEIRRVLDKIDRPPVGEEMLTAFRDGQVTTRAARGKEGFTNAWTDGARVQGVAVGDVVVHGLDGFSGAIGDAEAEGVCSPVYHVCQTRNGGDPAFYGRLLRGLALSGYLGNFAVSTRERAVDFRNWDLFGRIPIPLTSPAEQRRIGDWIRNMRPLVELVRGSEALASERKDALATQVVLGDVPVPGAA